MAHGSHLAKRPTELVQHTPRSAIEPDSPNYFKVLSERPVSHLRLQIYPDGGVARLRAFGEVRLAREQFAKDELVDLADLKRRQTSTMLKSIFQHSCEPVDAEYGKTYGRWLGDKKTPRRGS